MKDLYQILLIKIISIIFISILLTIRRDGYFPLKSDTNDLLMIIISSIHIVVIGFLTLIFLKPNLLINKFKVKPLNFKIDSRYILIFFVLISLVITFVIYCKDYLVYKELYSFNILFVSSLFLISSILISIPIVLKRPKLAIFGIIVGSTLISLVPIIFFPITSKIGDLMPILYKQAEALMNNQNIYQYYLLDNGVLTQAVRQPGTVIAYLPAYIFQFDLRIMSILYTVLTAFIFIKISYKKIREIKFNKKWVLFFLGLGIFLLSPYRLSRLDIYEPPFWFLLSLSMYLLINKKMYKFSIIWAIGIFTQVWFWLFTPFIGVYLLKNFKVRFVFKYTSVILLLTCILLVPFILQDLSSYKEHVFGFYKTVIDIGHYNNFSFYLTPWFIKLGIGHLLNIVQILIVGLIGILALKKIHSIQSLMGYLTIIFFFFIQFNSLTWNYMYLNLIVLLLIYFFYKLEQLDT